MGIILNGNVIDADDVLGCMRTTVEAGEIIATGDACYIKLDDGKAYISGTGAQTDYRVNGIALAGVSAAADVTLITRGKWVTTGLTDKEVYYLGAAGAISTTQSSIKVGVADGTTALYIDIVQDDRDAVGTVKSVLLTLAGTPTLTAFWHLCDGTVLTAGAADPESPLNGQTIPDLNASAGTARFLRGATTSGGTGGTETHQHKLGLVISSTNLYAIDGGKYGGSGNFVQNWRGPQDGSGTSTVGPEVYSETVGTLPSYYEVVWVIKIK